MPSEVLGKDCAFTLGDTTFKVNLADWEEVKKEPLPPESETVTFDIAGGGKLTLGGAAAADFAFLKSDKPPMGIEPEWLWKERRAKALAEAILRYLDSNLAHERSKMLSQWSHELFWLLECEESNEE